MEQDELHEAAVERDKHGLTMMFLEDLGEERLRAFQRVIECLARRTRKPTIMSTEV